MSIASRAAGARGRKLELRTPRPVGEARSDARLYEHYLIERELADRLRHASAKRRVGLYPAIYDELFRRVHDHPMKAGHGDRAVEVGHDLALLRRFLAPGISFAEIGAGDCALACRVAEVAGRVAAIDVSAEIMAGANPPANVERILSDGRSVPVEEGSVDVAFSDQLMEHLHPDDALEQLRNVHRALRPGGVYVCITPNRYYGPRDISMYFDEVASGLHLREYSAGELVRLLREVGFRRWTFFAGARGLYVRVPAWLPIAAERLLEFLPQRLRRRLADTRPMRSLLGIRIAAFK
jgi:SAM-dependent methyltransferase